MNILLTGGSGFVGSALVPSLLARGHLVTVIDLMLFGNHLPTHPCLRVVKGDIREMPAEVRHSAFDAVIHLACIANDPSWALDPALGKSVNYDALGPLVKMAKDSGATRFIYASSSSVYGTKPDGVEVTEELALQPLTDYSKYKALGEDVVLAEHSSDFAVTVLRPATVCGYAPRLRLDVVVNQMTIDALVHKSITVHGGSQRRANLHIADMVRAYIATLDAHSHLIGGRVFNVGGENMRIREIAECVQQRAGGEIVYEAQTDDPRSYTLNSGKIWRVLGFRPFHAVDEAIRDVCRAFTDGDVPDPLATHYYNLRQMQACLIS